MVSIKRLCFRSGFPFLRKSPKDIEKSSLVTPLIMMTFLVLHFLMDCIVVITLSATKLLTNTNLGFDIPKECSTSPVIVIEMTIKERLYYQLNNYSSVIYNLNELKSKVVDNKI